MAGLELDKEEGGLPNWSESRTRPSTGLSRRKSFLPGCSTGDGVEDRNGVGVGVRVCIAVGVDVAVDVGVPVGVGLGVEIGVGVPVGVGLGVDVGVGVPVSIGLGVEIGVGVPVDVGLGVDVGVGFGVGDRLGDDVGSGEDSSINGSSVGSVSGTFGDCSLGAGVGLRPALDPGSDQPPTLSPLTKVVCNRV